MSFKIPKNIYKKVSKEINMVYETEDFTLNSVSIPSEMTNQLITKIDSSNLFQIILTLYSNNKPTQPHNCLYCCI